MTLIAVALRAQVRRVKVQVPTVGSIVNLRLPVVATPTSVVQTTITIAVVASAEEGERKKKKRKPMVLLENSNDGARKGI